MIKKDAYKAESREDDILDELINLALSRFTWKNLPNGLTSEQLEMLLIEHGKLMGFEDKTKGLMILPAHGEKDFNIYGLPIYYRVNSLNGKYDKTIDIEDGVLLWNNPSGTSDLNRIRIFAKRLDNVEMTEEINLFQQNMPKLILTEENTGLSAKAILDKLAKFKFAIIGKKSLTQNITSSDVLDTSAPFILDKLSDYKQNLKSEILTYLGIKNNNVQKRERLITDEVNANNEYTNINLDLMFDMRNKFCTDFNAKFGSNIIVEKREVECNELYNRVKGDSGK